MPYFEYINFPDKHICYVIISLNHNKIYIGYTVDFQKRLRQHNGEITGGAKKTCKYAPWKLLCFVKGFIDNHMALRFEYRMHKMMKNNHTKIKLIKCLISLIAKGEKENPWPFLQIAWADENDMKLMFSYPPVKNLNNFPI